MNVIKVVIFWLRYWFYCDFEVFIVIYFVKGVFIIYRYNFGKLKIDIGFIMVKVLVL